MSGGPRDASEGLFEAISRDDLDAVTAFVAAGVDVNGLDAAGDSPLLYACAGGHLSAAAQLLSAGADPLAESEDGVSPLLALFEGVSRARLLADLAALQAHAHHSIEGFRSFVREVVTTPPTQPGDVDHELEPPEGFRPVLEALLERGARVDAVDELGRNALAIAVCEGYPLWVVKALLDHGGDPYQQDEDGLCAADFARSHPSAPVHAMLDASN